MKKIIQSRNKREGKYKGYRFGKHYHSLNKLVWHIKQEYGNPFYTGPIGNI